jgi:hypothetical protein
MRTENISQGKKDGHSIDGVMLSNLLHLFNVNVNLDEVHMGVLLRERFENRLNHLARWALSSSKVDDLQGGMSNGNQEHKMLTVSLLGSLVYSLRVSRDAIWETIFVYTR